MQEPSTGQKRLLSATKGLDQMRIDSAKVAEKFLEPEPPSTRPQAPTASSGTGAVV